MTRDDLLAKLEAEGVPAGPINNLAQVFADPQVVARGMQIERPNTAAKSGKVPGVRTPISFDGWGAAAEHGAPQFGPAYRRHPEGNRRSLILFISCCRTSSCLSP